MDDKVLDMIVAQVMDKVGGNGDAAPAAAAAFRQPRHDRIRWHRLW